MHITNLFYTKSNVLYYIVFRRIFISISNLYLNIYYLWRFSLILEKNAWVYVAGSSKNMPGWNDIRYLNNDSCNLQPTDQTKRREWQFHFFFKVKWEKRLWVLYLILSEKMQQKSMWRKWRMLEDIKQKLGLRCERVVIFNKLITRIHKGTKNPIICMRQLATILPCQ